MCDEWMKRLELPLTFEQFERLPRNPAYKYEYYDERAWLTPRPRYYHALLDLRPLATAPLGGLDATAVVRPLRADDWEALVPLFGAAFELQPPFGALDDEQRTAAARKSLEFTRTGGDGPVIERACFVAHNPHVEWLAAAALVTLLPLSDLTQFGAYHWRETPPPDAIERRLGRPHLTWIFVAPLFTGHGMGTALLNAVGRELLTLGYEELASTFLRGNDSSMLWHWRQGFQLLGHPGSMRRDL